MFTNKFKRCVRMTQIYTLAYKCMLKSQMLLMFISWMKPYNIYNVWMINCAMNFLNGQISPQCFAYYHLILHCLQVRINLHSYRCVGLSGGELLYILLLCHLFYIFRLKTLILLRFHVFRFRWSHTNIAFNYFLQ